MTVLGIRFVPGTRLAVVLGPTSSSRSSTPTRAASFASLEHRPDDPDESDPATPGVSADGSLLATRHGASAATSSRSRCGRSRAAVSSAIRWWSTARSSPAAEPGRAAGHRRARQRRARGRRGGGVGRPHTPPRPRAASSRRSSRSRASAPTAGCSWSATGPAGRACTRRRRSSRSRACSPTTPGGIISAAITPDDRTLATGSETGAVQLWDIRSGQALGAPLPGVPRSGVIPAFTPDGATSWRPTPAGARTCGTSARARWSSHACAVAGRRLTRAEWAEFLPGRDYDPAC